MLLGCVIDEISYRTSYLIFTFFLTRRHVLYLPADDSTHYWPERAHSIKPPETRINNTESGEFSWGGILT